MVKVYIDGQAGTTGLKINERLAGRNDIELLEIAEEKRKDNAERKRLIHESDFTFLCLPDTAAIEAVGLANGSSTRIIDASTAHRTNPDWAYGFPELSGAHREKIKNSSRVAVPGCYPTGFLAVVYPLVAAGILPKDYPVVCHAVSGYSGGGKAMIAEYEAVRTDKRLFSPRHYALTQSHKHQPEMQKIAGLEYTPIFNPMVGDFYSGMTVSVPIFTRLLSKKVGISDVKEALKAHYSSEKMVRVMEYSENAIFAQEISGKNHLEIFVFGNDERIQLMSRLDNLGKGASGAAVQCFNIMNGFEEDRGL